jgi:GNAT superfamily N-acetyltransferase
VAGYLLYANTGLVAHISKLAVAEGFRRRGVGAALVAAAVEEAQRGRRLQSLTLHVAEDNAPALALYRSQRFDTEGVLRVRCLPTTRCCLWALRTYTPGGGRHALGNFIGFLPTMASAFVSAGLLSAGTQRLQAPARTGNRLD